MIKGQLIVKNVPRLDAELKRQLINHYGAVDVKGYGRNRLILRFADEQQASRALYSLHQTDLNGRVLSVEYLRCEKRNKADKIAEAIEENPALIPPHFIKNLYATSLSHGFEQPPPPYLRYNYPSINRDILDSISIALMTNTKFYHQVLHLMNRMNLDPPFLPLERIFMPPGAPCDAQTQTDFGTTDRLLASDESELESDSETIKIPAKKKRKPIDDFVIKAKIRKIISSHLHDKQSHSVTERKEQNIKEIFESEKRDFPKKISLNVSTVKLPDTETSQQPIQTPVETAKTAQQIDEPFEQNRIPDDQLKDLPVFKNYKRGERSNKLYIKNLSRDVTESDLRNMYGRFVKDRSDIEIKLMLYGKMKGQAFVTFNNLPDDSNFEQVERALAETNGYIMKGKPMIVCFGKKS